VAARRVRKAGRKSEGLPASPLSSISDKNKVNGEWGCRRDGCCSTGVNGEKARESCYGAEGMMLLRLGRIKAKGEKQKIRRSMLPTMRNIMKTLRFSIFPHACKSHEFFKVIQNLINTDVALSDYACRHLSYDV